ncbi:MAG: hypothetical protein WCE38_19325 [Burkholderiales bacterium]
MRQPKRVGYRRAVDSGASINGRLINLVRSILLVWIGGVIHAFWVLGKKT